MRQPNELENAAVNENTDGRDTELLLKVKCCAYELPKNDVIGM